MVALYIGVRGVGSGLTRDGRVYCAPLMRRCWVQASATMGM